MNCDKILVFMWILFILLFDLTHLPLDKNGCHFADDIFKSIFVNEKFYILIPISLKFVPEVPIDNESALVQVMVWGQTGTKPLPESMSSLFTDALGGDELIEQTSTNFIMPYSIFRASKWKRCVAFTTLSCVTCMLATMHWLQTDHMYIPKFI